MVVIELCNEIKTVVEACRVKAEKDPLIRALYDGLYVTANAYMDGVVKAGHTSKVPSEETILLRDNLVGSLAALGRQGVSFPDLPHRDLCECLVSAMKS